MNFNVFFCKIGSICDERIWITDRSIRTQWRRRNILNFAFLSRFIGEVASNWIFSIVRHIENHRTESCRSNHLVLFRRIISSTRLFICLSRVYLFVCRGIRRRIKKISYFCAMSHISILFRKRDVCDTRFSAAMHDNVRRDSRTCHAKSGKMSDTYRKRSIISLTIKSNDKPTYKRLHRDNARYSDNMEEPNLISRRNRYTQRNTSIVIAKLIREATLPWHYRA